MSNSEDGNHLSSDEEFLYFFVNMTDTGNYTNGTDPDPEYNSGGLDTIAGVSPDLEYYLKGVALPLLGLIGVFGNTMNLIVLSWRYKRRDVDVLEKGALLGLIALAFSDLCFCLGLLPQAFLSKTRSVFDSRGLPLYYQMYSAYYENVFIKISTGLTLLVGVARYVGICHPLRLNARLFIGLQGIRVAICLIYSFWIIALVPMWWNYYPIEFNTGNSTKIVLDLGPMITKRHLKLGFIYFWTCLGYFIPVSILVFCNIRLISALWESARLRERSVRKTHLASRDYTVKITLTLVFLILSFIFLVSPSEILHFYADVVQAHNYAAFDLAVLCTNILQTVNFAFHFLLYCVVNASFRRALLQVFSSKCKCNTQELKVIQIPLPYNKLDRDYLGRNRHSRTTTSKSAQSYL